MARDKARSEVILAERTKNTDAQSRRLLNDGLTGRDVLTITVAPRVYTGTGNKLLPGNSHKFRLVNKAQAVEMLRRFAEWADGEKKRIEGGSNG